MMPQKDQGDRAVVPREYEEGSVQWLWNQFCAEMAEADSGNIGLVEKLVARLNVIVRWRLAPFLTPGELKEIPSFEACREGAEKEKGPEIRREFAEMHTGWDKETLAATVEPYIDLEAVKRRADPVAGILARLGWLEPLRPEKARV